MRVGIASSFQPADVDKPGFSFQPKVKYLTEVDTESPAACAGVALPRNSLDSPNILGILYGTLTPRVVGFGCIEAHCPGRALLAYVAGLSVPTSVKPPSLRHSWKI